MSLARAHAAHYGLQLLPLVYFMLKILEAITSKQLSFGNRSFRHPRGSDDLLILGW